MEIGVQMHVDHLTAMVSPFFSSESAKDPSHELSNGMMASACGSHGLPSPDANMFSQRNIVSQLNDSQLKRTLGYLLSPQAWSERDPISNTDRQKT